LTIRGLDEQNAHTVLRLPLRDVTTLGSARTPCTAEIGGDQGSSARRRQAHSWRRVAPRHPWWTIQSTLVALAFVPGLAAGDGGPVPLDPHEQQVNTYTTSYQLEPQVAATSDGHFLVTWKSYGSHGDDDSGASIQARRFRPGGSAIDPQELQVNTYTLSDQKAPDVAALSGGDFVVVWESWLGLDLAKEIRSRRLGPSGEPLDAPERPVNVNTTSMQSRPTVAALPEGGFVVVWEDQTSWVRFRRFRGDGTAIDSQDIQVNVEDLRRNDRAHVAAGPDGGFVVVWMSYDGFDAGIWGRRFGPDAEPLDAVEFLVNTYTPGMQYDPRVAVDPDGDFVVVWTSYLSPEDGDDFAVRARRFARDGTPQDASDFQVNTFTTRQQWAHDVQTDAEGNFVVTWFSGHADPLDSTVAARRFRKDGSSVDPVEFELPTRADGSKGAPALARTPDGDFSAVWVSTSSYGDDQDQSIQVRRFGRPTFPVVRATSGTPAPHCSLVDAIEAANTGVAVGGSPAGNQGAVLRLPVQSDFRFSTAVEGSNALPIVRRSVTIRGEGSHLRRDPALPCPGGPDLRLLEVADGGILALEDVDVTDGCVTSVPGGGVLVEGGTLVLRRATIAGNTAGGFGGGVAVEDGHLLAFDSVISANIAASRGGGLAVAGNPGWLQVERSTFAGNAAANGGGLSIASGGFASILQSTFSDNEATAGGGGLELDAAAAGLAIDRVTIAGNSAAEGSGFRLAAGRAHLHGTVIGDGLDGADCSAAAGVLGASGSNLDTDGSCAALAGTAVSTVVSLGLAPLTDQGGPTPTRLPLSGSPTLDAETDCTTRGGARLSTDQRGFPRPTDDDGDGEAACDLGAVERGPIFVDGFESGSIGRWSGGQKL
jgi:hypothetical protein